MKFCIVTHCVIKGDGQGRVNYEVVKEAIRRGHYVTLLASEVDPELQRYSQINWVKISVQGVPTELLRNIVFAQKSAAWLQKHRSEFDLIQVNGAITSCAGDVNAAHFIHSAWQQAPVNMGRKRGNLYGLYQWLYTALNAHWEKKAFKQAKVVVAVSEKVKKELIDIGVAAEIIRVVVNGVDLQEFSPGSVERTCLGLPEDVPLALFAGDIRTPRKNLDTVLNALVEVPSLHLAVAGSTQGSPYPSLAEALGLSERVHFLGFRRDIAKLMQACDLFVFPSRYEACTLVLLEAMASGLPVITASTTGGAEVVKPEAGIVLSNPNDTQELVKALNTLAGDRELCNSMSQASRAIAQQLSWNTMAQTYINVFEHTVNEAFNFVAPFNQLVNLATIE